MVGRRSAAGPTDAGRQRRRDRGERTGEHGREEECWAKANGEPGRRGEGKAGPRARAGTTASAWDGSRVRWSSARRPPSAGNDPDRERPRTRRDVFRGRQRPRTASATGQVDPHRLTSAPVGSQRQRVASATAGPRDPRQVDVAAPGERGRRRRTGGGRTSCGRSCGTSSVHRGPCSLRFDAAVVAWPEPCHGSSTVDNSPPTMWDCV